MLVLAGCGAQSSPCCTASIRFNRGEPYVGTLLNPDAGTSTPITAVVVTDNLVT